MPDVRPFTAADLPAMQAVRAAAFAPVFRSFRDIVGPQVAAVALARAEEEQAALLERLCAPDSGQAVLVAERDGAVVGFVAFSVDAAGLGEVVLIAVHPDHAGRGTGGAMLEAALERMRALGARAATVGVGGDESHAAARRAYRKAGFGPGIPSVHLYRML